MDDKTQTKTEEVKPAENTGEGIQSEADKTVEQINADTERINKAIAENDNAKARQKLSGTAEAGAQAEKPKEETNAEYAGKVMAGET